MAGTDLRRLLRRPGLKVGHGVFEFATPGIGQILKAAGVEFTFIDMEHTGFDLGDIKRLVAYMRAADLPCMVRAPSRETHHLSRVLDVGADGLMVSNVETADQARAACDAAKYPPMGRRAVAVQVAHDRYRPATIAETIRATNRRTAVILMIETAEGVENADAIAAVDGVDCLWLGHYDLSTSLGVPGDFAAPVFTAAVDRIIAAARRHRRSLGRMVMTAQDGRAAFAQGFDALCYGGDIWTYADAVSQGVAALRQACGGKKRQ